MMAVLGVFLFLMVSFFFFFFWFGFMVGFFFLWGDL